MQSYRQTYRRNKQLK